MRTDDLISQLSAGLEPVRRVMAPWRAALAWLGFAALLVGIAVAWSGLRHDIATRLMVMEEQVNLAAALATGIAAAFAAFLLALPDRSPRWGLLPVPFAVLWVSGLGLGCLRDLAETGSLGMGTSFGCMRFILGFGVPLTVAMLWMARHGALVRPGPVAALGGLAAAAVASVGLSLVHHLDAAAMVLVWHGGSVALVTLVSWLWGPRAMRAARRDVLSR
jgi:hypothetical protein